MPHLTIELKYHEKQREIFFSNTARYKVIAKGRRFGLTKGFANYVIERMLEGTSPVLWVDTVYGNIERYVERYFKPVLRSLPRSAWRYRAYRKDLRVFNSVCDFRSADKPEHIEGFGYALIILNEAGIILRDRNLWSESIRPMALDYKAEVLIGGTPKGKYIGGDGHTHLFFELYQRGLPQNPTHTTTAFPPSPVDCRLMTDDLSPTDNRLWHSFNFSTYDNPLLERAEIDEMVKEISPALRDQEVFGLFIDGTGNPIMRAEWWKFFGLAAFTASSRQPILLQSWDTAFKIKAENDFSVCTTWEHRDGGFYLLDMWRGRVEFPELKRIASELNARFSPRAILIEDRASGQSLVQELCRGLRLPIVPVKPASDKLARAHSITPLIEAGRVFLPDAVPYLGDILREWQEFPYGQFDDIVDSMTQALTYMRDKWDTKSSLPVSRKYIPQPKNPLSTAFRVRRR